MFTSLVSHYVYFFSTTSCFKITLVPVTARMSSMERETVDVEAMNIQYEELLKEHKESESQTFSSEEIKEALMATQNPSQGLTARNAEVLTGMLTFEDIHLKHAAVQGIANCATFTYNQVRNSEWCVLSQFQICKKTFDNISISICIIVKLNTGLQRLQVIRTVWLFFS